MPVYSLEGITPVVHPDAFVHETAVLIGDVIIGSGCYIGPNASLRGDFGRIVIKQGANVQDTCVMHTFPGKDCIVERDGHIGHGAVLHGCLIGVNAMVGMNAVVMDDAQHAGVDFVVLHEVLHGHVKDSQLRHRHAADGYLGMHGRGGSHEPRAEQ